MSTIASRRLAGWLMLVVLINRVARERGLGTDRAPELERLIGKITEAPDSRVIGESKVNTLRLNLALEQL